MLMHKGTQTIETARLILRRAVREDAQPMLQNWAADPEVTKYLTWQPHESIQVTQQLLDGWVTEYEKSDYYHWMIVLKELGQPIGSLLVTTVGRAQSAHVGYCIGKAWWHQGIMSEALQAVIAYLFEEVGYHRIESMHDPNNPNSGRVMRKCGMKYEGTAHAADRNNQGICDADYYAILRSDWSKPRHFMEGFATGSDTALVQEIYCRKNENDRLSKSKAARVEFLTTVRYIEKYLTPGAKILDVGAGAGEYSLYFSRNGYRVSALELADQHCGIPGENGFNG
jgi:RimJ/RimL family protein N-acetyltransferase